MRWLGSKDSNLDCMIQSHESIKIDLSPRGRGVDKTAENNSVLVTHVAEIRDIRERA
jgi:hypothetical protein